MKWLVTAFEPFAHAKTNSSLIVAQALQREYLNAPIEFHFPLPVSYKNAWTDLQSKIQNSERYAGILALGQAEKRQKISLERVALNWIDASIPDNDGITIQNRKISTGPTTFWNTLPWDHFTLPTNCERSYSAGTFVCNQLMYKLAEWGERHQIPTGFVHLPLVSGQELDFPKEQLHTLQNVTSTMKDILNFLFQSTQ